MVKLTVNSIEVEVENGSTILQACEIAGFEIPRFCYHDKLAIAGNCRMCLVEVEGGPPKPVASCAMPVSEGMKVVTNSKMVRDARENVMEFLLINHPLDCPVCDQGGECDLQDQAYAYGNGKSRYREAKRAVKAKDFGPLIQDHMTRCIHCTRCVRFLSEVAGTNELGTIGRGNHMEINTALGKKITSELSGNIIDLCPVGALTSKPYPATFRAWELKRTETIDVTDATGSAISIDCKGLSVMRIIPRINEKINEEWISDKARFSHDGLNLQRLARPYVRQNGVLSASDWETAFEIIRNKLTGLRGSEIAALAGDLADCESMLLLKEFMEYLGSPNLDCRQDSALVPYHNRFYYTFNTGIANIENADLCLLICADLKVEAPVVNARLLKGHLYHGMKIFSMGSHRKSVFPVTHIGDDPNVLLEILNGTHCFSQELRDAKRPIIIVGQSLFMRDDIDAIVRILEQIVVQYNLVRDGWNGFNVLHRVAGRVGGLDVGFVPKNNGMNVREILSAAKNGAIKFLYLLGADEIPCKFDDSVFVVYQGHHGDAGAHSADVVLPGCTFIEKVATFVNTEGRVQRTTKVLPSIGNALDDWIIIRDLVRYVGHCMPYYEVSSVWKKLATIDPCFINIGETREHVSDIQVNGNLDVVLHSVPLVFSDFNFYMTNPISRSSRTMTRCSKAFVECTI